MYLSWSRIGQATNWNDSILSRFSRMLSMDVINERCAWPISTIWFCEAPESWVVYGEGCI